MGADLRERAAVARAAVAENPVWYHTIELAPGVVTPGQVDLRGVADRVLPRSLEGRRALDVGTFDGFWAFEMERRGAQVVAIDVASIDENEWPPRSRATLARKTAASGLELGRGFATAARTLGSSAARVVSSVYDVTAETIGGAVDFAFSGSILLHLRDPVRALEAIHGTLRPGGELRQMEPFSASLTLRSPSRPLARFEAADSEFNWWYPNLAAVLAQPRAAGFEEVRRLAIVRPPSVRQMRQLYAVVSSRRR